MMVKYELLGCPKGQLGLFMLILSIGMVMEVTELELSLLVFGAFLSGDGD